MKLLALWICCILDFLNALDPRQVRIYEEDVHKGDIESALPLFKPENFIYHTPFLLDGIPTDEKAAQRVANLLSSNNLLEMLTEDDMMLACKTWFVYLGEHYDKIYDKTRRMSEDSFVVMLESGFNKEFIKLIPLEFVQTHTYIFATHLSQIRDLTVEQIRIISNVPGACEMLEPDGLKKCFCRHKWEALSPKCFAKIKGLGSADFSNVLNKGIVPADAFTYVDKALSPETLGAMTAKHMKFYGSEILPPIVPLHQLKPSAMAGVYPLMFVRYLEEAKPREIKFKEHWNFVPKNLFLLVNSPEKLKKFAEDLSVESYEYMPKIHINRLLEYPEACEFFPDGLKLNKRKLSGLKLSSQCFANMKPGLQKSILTSGVTLPDNLLEYMTVRHLLRLETSIYTLNKIKAKNRITLIENLSSKIHRKQNHACYLIKDIHSLKRMKIFQLVVPKRCWQFLGFEIQVKNVIKNPKILAGRPKVLKTLLQNEARSGKSFNMFSKQDILRLTRGKAGQECKYMTKRQFESLTGGHISALSPECIAHIKFFNELGPEDTQFIGTTAFSEIDASRAKGMNFHLFLNEHLEHLSENIVYDQTAGKTLTKDVLENQITPERLNHLPARVWGTIPPEAFTIFRNAEILGTIAGEKMAYWSKEQVRMIPKETLANMNPDQALLIGNLSGRKKELGDYLKEIMPKTDPNVKAILGERFGIGDFSKGTKTNSASLSHFSIPSILLSILFAAALLA